VTGQPILLSVSQAYTLRLAPNVWESNGEVADPRNVYTPQFQLVTPGAGFGTWVAGAWEAFAPPGGPYAATVIVGAGQPAGVNPGEAGTYQAWVRFLGSADSPAFQVGTVVLSAP
jgi:hypothetical protein